MKNKLRIMACSLFLSVGTITTVVVLNDYNNGNIFSPSTVKADTSYFLTLNSSNKYNGGNQSVATDKGNGAVVGFAYTNASQSSQGHVILANGGTLKNIDQLTSLSYFVPSFSLGNGASLKFRASDRTGLIALLSNALLGVELQEIFQDYLFSDFGCIGKVSTVGQANEDSIAEYVEELKAFPGEKLQNKVYNFLLTAGVPAQKLDNMINFLTEPGSVKGNDVKKVDVQTVDHMTTDLDVTTVDLTTNLGTSTRSPAKYVTFNAANQKVTYTFNASEPFTADLYANLCSKTTSGNLNTAFEVKVNGTAITVANTSFATKELGFDSNIECWIPSKLGEVSINQGSNTVEITALKTTSIKFSQFAFSSMSAP